MVDIRHEFVSPRADGPDSSDVRPSNWNAAHVITGSLGGRIHPLTEGSLFDDFTDAWTTTPPAPWSVLGSPTVLHADTVPSHLYVERAAAANSGLTGIMRNWSPSDGDYIEAWFTDHYTNFNNHLAAIFIGEAGGTGKFKTLQAMTRYATNFDDRIVGYNWTDRTTVPSEQFNQPNPFGALMPVGFRIARVSSSSYTYWVSMGGLAWNILFTGDPGFTVAVAGIGVNTSDAAANQAVKVYADYFNGIQGGA